MRYTFVYVLSYFVCLVAHYLWYGNWFGNSMVHLYESTRAPLPFYVNELLGDIWAVAFFHIFIAGVCFYFLCSLIENKAGKRIFTIIMSWNILFHQQIMEFYDTTLFALSLALVLYFSVKRKNYLLCLSAVLGWYSRATGIIYWALVPLFSNKTILPLALFAVITIPYSMSLSSVTGVGSYNIIKGNSEYAFENYPFVDLDEGDTQGVRFELVDSFNKFIYLTSMKTLMMFSPFYVPLDLDGIVSSKVSLLQLPYLFVYISFILFLYNYRKTELGRNVFYISVLFALIHMATWMETRFRAPIEPIMFMSAAIQLGERRG